MTTLIAATVLALQLSIVPTIPKDILCGPPTKFEGDFTVLQDGYCDHRGRWVPGLITIETYERRSPTHIVGNVVWYNIGVMELAFSHHGIDPTLYVDGVALMSCSDFGQTVWLKRPNHDWEGPFIAIDCAARQDMYSAIYYGGEVAEIGFKTATAWGLVSLDENGKRVVHNWSLEGVEVYIGPNPPSGSTAIEYTSWWIANAALTNGADIP